MTGEIPGASVKISVDTAELEAAKAKGGGALDALIEKLVKAQGPASQADRAFASVGKTINKMAAEITGNGASAQLGLMEQALAKAGGRAALTDTQMGNLAKRIESLRAAGGSVPQTLNQVTLAAKGTGDAFGALGGQLAQAVVAYVSFRAAAGLVSESMTALGQKQDALNKLTLALANQGRMSAENVTNLRDYAEALGKVSTYSQNAIVSAESYFIGLGLNIEQTKKATQASADFAAKTGKELPEAAEALGKAIETGSGKELAKFGITVDKTMSAQERLLDITRQIESRYGGSAAAATATYTGGLKQLQKAQEEAKASFGLFLSQLSGSDKPFGTATSAIDSLAKYIRTDLITALSEARAEYLELLATATKNPINKAAATVGDYLFDPLNTLGGRNSLFGGLKDGTDYQKQADAIRERANKAVRDGIGATIAPPNNPKPPGMADPLAQKESAKADAEFWKEDAEAAKLYTETLGKLREAQGESIAPINKEIAAHQAARDAIYQKTEALRGLEKEHAAEGTISKEQLATAMATDDATERQADATQKLADKNSILKESTADADRVTKAHAETEKLLGTILADRLSPLQRVILTIQEKKKEELAAVDAEVKHYEAEHQLTLELALSLEEKKKAIEAANDHAVALAEEKDAIDKVSFALDGMGSLLSTVGKAAGGKAGPVLGAGGSLFGSIGGLVKGGGFGDLFKGGGAGLFGGGGIDDATGGFVKDSLGQTAAKLLGGIGKAVPIAGAAIGLIQGIASALTKPEYMKVMEDVGKHWGTKITEGTAKAIQDTEKTAGVSRQMAELLNLDKIMADSGADPAKFKDKIGDLFNAAKLGVVDMKDAVSQLGKAFTDMKTAADGGSSASQAAMVGMIRRAKELQLSIPEIDAAMKTWAQNEQKSLGDFIKGQNAKFTGNNGELVGGVVSAEQAKANDIIFGAVEKANIAFEGLVQAAEDSKDALDGLQKSLPPGSKLSETTTRLLQANTALENSPLFKGSAVTGKAAGDILGNMANRGEVSQDVAAAFATTFQNNYAQSLAGLKDQNLTPDEQRKLAEEANLPLLTQLDKAEAQGAQLDAKTQAAIDQTRTDGLLPLKDVNVQQLEVLKQIRDGKKGDGAPSTGAGVPIPTRQNLGIGAPSDVFARFPDLAIGLPQIPRNMALPSAGAGILSRAQGGGTSVSVTSPTTINVYPQPGQSPEEIAKAVATALDRNQASTLKTQINDHLRGMGLV